ILRRFAHRFTEQRSYSSRAVNNPDCRQTVHTGKWWSTMTNNAQHTIAENQIQIRWPQRMARGRTSVRYHGMTAGLRTINAPKDKAAFCRNELLDPSSRQVNHAIAQATAKSMNNRASREGSGRKAPAIH